MERRIAVVGASGNGKSTVGRALAEQLGVAYVELDALHHGPNWVEASADELCDRVEAVIRTGGWVVDGNYHSKIGDLVLSRADTVVWLDQPLPLILWRLLRRTLGRIRNETVLWNGNRETWRNAFFARDSLFAWTVRSYFRHHRTFPTRLAALEGVEVVRLRSPRAVRAWLANGSEPPERARRRSRRA